MELGAFSVSLSVKDLAKSKEFYEKLGFEKTGGEGDYLIMANGTTLIGLFQGIIESNILTFNPGLNNHKEPLDNFNDIRQIREDLVKQEVTFTADLDPEETGPAHLLLQDPDGNTIMIDQFFPKPNG